MIRGQLIKLIIICSFVVLFFSLSGCIDDNGGGDGGSEEDWRKWPIVQSSGSESGHCSEGETEIEEFDISDYYVTKINISLTWEDEPPFSEFYENQPDSFNISVTTPWQEKYYSGDVANPIGGVGQINLTIDFQENETANNSAVGNWVVNIICIDCGNQERQSGMISMADSGNSWELSYYYEYHSGDGRIVRW